MAYPFGPCVLNSTLFTSFCTPAPLNIHFGIIAGLDLLEMYEPKSVGCLEEFWASFQECWATLYASRLATIAAVGGHAPAAGCGLVLACDFRIGAEGPFTIGLNEAQFGIVAPTWFIPPLQNVVGKHQAGAPMVPLWLLILS